jgi:hypothetical protein
MKRQSQYTFRPYSPRRRDWREWPGWHLVAFLIVIIVCAIVVRACCG